MDTGVKTVAKKRSPKYETSIRAVVRELEQQAGLPHLVWHVPAKGDKEPRGTRLRAYGQTPEERYMQYAPEGTAPERLLFGWLKRHGFLFSFQQPVMGGRSPGGAIIDFIIYDKNPPIALRVMSYWHDSLAAHWTDDLQRERLVALGYQVEDVWEYDINTIEHVDETMRGIMYGQRGMR